MRSKEDFLKLLEFSFNFAGDVTGNKPMSKLSWVGDVIFDFTCYDDVASETFAYWAIVVAKAISERKTFECMEKNGDIFYLTMVNMPFFIGRLEWGTSIRGAWWDIDRPYPNMALSLDTDGIYSEDGKQLCPLKFNDNNEWLDFMDALYEFTNEEMAKKTEESEKVNEQG